MDKKELRKLIRTQKRHFTQQQLGEMSLSAIRQLLSNEHIVCAKTVMMYCSLTDEVDTRKALHQLIDAGKQVVLPVVVDDSHMVLRRYHSDADLCEGAYHILEPTGPVFEDVDAIDVVVVPGMAFDAAGHRLGRGKGYYDRFLARCPKAWRIGICFGFQLLPHVPVEDTDVVMNEVIASAEAATHQ